MYTLLIQETGWYKLLV